ncbi:hypothetical protein ACFFJB_06165 [Camelimonas abortus]|uniref:DUF4340 domain-containing protein n=1 Tax=Camelimonas abortus TaxID=1017184 RepID=A0ABV7LIY1_9HYPH
MNMSRRSLIAMTMAGALCAGMAVSVPAVQAAGAGAPKQVDVRGLGAVDVESLELRIVKVDLATRTLVVEKAGRQWRVVVPEDVGSINGLRPRDKLYVNRVEGALVSVAPPKSGKPDVVYETARDDGLFNGLPARWLLRKVIATVRFQKLDQAKGEVTYDGPEGKRTIRVIDPAVMTALAKLKKGELVTFTFTQATEYVVQPRRI